MVEESADPWFHLLLRDFTWTIFILISIVALFGFYFFHRRRQRQIAELPDHLLKHGRGSMPRVPERYRKYLEALTKQGHKQGGGK